MVYQKSLIDNNGTVVGEFSSHLAAFEVMILLGKPEWRPAYAKTYMTDTDRQLYQEIRDAKFA